MHRLVYCSQTSDQTVSTVESILKQSRHNNEALGITGILLCYEGSYIQILEGEKETIANLYTQKIAKDRRHQYVTELVSQKITSRAFPDWRMECCFLDQTAKFKGVEHKAWRGLLSISENSSQNDVERIIAPFRGFEILTNI